MPQGEPLLILHVEDDPAHAEIARRNLERIRVPARIIHLADGQIALDYLFHQGVYANAQDCPRPDIILLDLRLPKVSGQEVLSRVKSHPNLATIPVVILSTSRTEDDVDLAYSHRVNSYLVKPLDLDQFSHLVESFGFYWLEGNTYPN